jgi:hypothetical protein
MTAPERPTVRKREHGIAITANLKKPLCAFTNTREKKRKMNKTFIFVFLISIFACSYSEADHSEPVTSAIDKLPKSSGKTPCGLYDLPNEHEPVLCGENPWTGTGHCCTWVTDEGEDECVTSWCLNEHLCEWMVNQRSCNLKE